ncbi:MAG TPA: glycosyltransferase, partial [Methanomassiliicoccales archaeon]|nr:glycosyltransferase [Methanomassiliicoccales archaeon]
MLKALTGLYPKASVLVMDDNSRDGTAEKVNELADLGHDVKVVVRDPSDKGLTASIIDGIALARTEYFVVMDCDFQHPPASVADLMDSMIQGSVLTIGVREDKFELSSTRKFASWGANTMASVYLRWKRRPTSEDTMSGFFAGRTDTFRSVIEDRQNKFERRGFKALFDLLKFLPRDSNISEVEFRFDSRRSGESKLSSIIILSIMRQCGIWGRGLAVVTSFFLTNMVGRYLTSLILSLLFTFGILGLTDTILTAEMSNAILVALLIAIGYLVVAN